MDDLTLAKKLLGKTKTSEDKAGNIDPSSATIVYMTAVTSSSNGEVVVKPEDEDSDDIWENGEAGVDFIELDEDGDFDEEAYDNVDDLEDVDDSVLDMTDGDGVDIELALEEEEAVAYTVAAYQADAQEAYAVALAEETETESVVDDLPDENASVTDEIDDGDAVDSPETDIEPTDPVPDESAEIAELTDDEFTASDDNDPDESDEPITAEVSDGSTVVETIGAVNEGDRVAVLIQNGVMTVIGVVGSGDEEAALRQHAAEAANEAITNAEEASTKAQTAITAADEAKTQAATAAEQAQTAKTEAESASAAANQAAASLKGITDDIASVKTDASQSLKDAINSVAETKVETMTFDFATQDDLKTQETNLKNEIERSAGKIQTTLEADYARKTELSEAKAELRSEITQTAESITSTVSDITDAMANTQDEAVRAQIAAAKANLESAKTDLSQAKTALNSAKENEQKAAANVAVAQNNASDADAELDEAQRELGKAQSYYDQLVEIGASAEDLSAAQAKVTEAQSAVENAQTAANEAQSALTNAQNEITEAQAAVTAAETNVATAQSAYDSAVEGLHTCNITAIQQTADSITLRATKTEVTEAVAGIEVGGRNLLRGTSTAEGWTQYTSFDSAANEFTKVNNTLIENYLYCNNLFDLEAGQEYTLSFKAKQSGCRTDVGHDIYILPKTWATTGIAYNPKIYNLTEEYQEYVFTFTPSVKATSLTDCQLRFDNEGAASDGSESTLCIKDIKLEKGNKATDWTPAPEDVDSSISDTKDELHGAVGELAATTDSISESIQQIEDNTNAAINSINDEMVVLTKKVEATVTASDVQFQIEQTVQNGTSKVTTSTGYTLDEEGLEISKSDSEMSTKITDDGMAVSKGGEKVLTANSEGVDAVNLHATTYLIIGDTSRFEDYTKDGKKRTGCFWIGETEV